MHIGLRAQEAVDGRVSVHSNVNEAPKGSCRGKSDAMKYTGSQCAMKNPLDGAAGRSKHFMDRFSVFKSQIKLKSVFVSVSHESEF